MLLHSVQHWSALYFHHLVLGPSRFVWGLCHFKIWCIKVTACDIKSKKKTKRANGAVTLTHKMQNVTQGVLELCINSFGVKCVSRGHKKKKVRGSKSVFTQSYDVWL